MIARLFSLLALVFLLLAPHPAAAQDPSADAAESPAPQLGDDLTEEAVLKVIALMSEREVREQLYERWLAEVEANSAAAGEEVGSADLVFNTVIGIRNFAIEAVQRLPLLWSGQSRSFANFWDERGADGVAYFIGVFALALIGGFAVEYGVNRLARGWRRKIDRQSAADQMGETLTALGLRLFLDLIGLIAFFIVLRIVLTNLAAPGDLELLRVITLNLVVYPRLAAAALRFFVAPRRPDLRLLNLEDDAAQYLHRHTIGVIALIGFSIGIVQFNVLNGVPLGEMRLGYWLVAIVHLYVIWIAWNGWNMLSTMLIEKNATPSLLEVRVARAYPGYVIAVSILAWLLVQILVANGRVDLVSAGEGFLVMGLFIIAPAFDALIRRFVTALSPPIRGSGKVAEEAYRSTQEIYVRIGRAVVAVAVVLLTARIFELNLSNMASAGLGAQFAARVIEILVVIAVGFLVYQLVTLWIDRKLAAELTASAADPSDEEPGGGEGGGAGGSRLSTVLPLARGALQVAVVVLTGLIALGNVGIDITPLLAGAGVVGLAIGFGAQKLVTDVVSGVFFLVDDAFRTGEYVDVEGTVGTVEKISVRSLQLRHHKGPVHTIPYGEIPKITNYSRDWVIMKLRFTVPFDTDLNKVKKIFKQIGQEMMEVPEYAEDMLQPFKSQGVLDVDDVGIIVRGKFMAKPGKQFTLRKEIYNRVQKAFEENGIQFARKEVRVRVDGLEEGRPLGEEEKQAVAAAAADAAEKAMEK